MLYYLAQVQCLDFHFLNFHKLDPRLIHRWQHQEKVNTKRAHFWKKSCDNARPTGAEYVAGTIGTALIREVHLFENVLSKGSICKSIIETWPVSQMCMCGYTVSVGEGEVDIDEEAMYQ